MLFKTSYFYQIRNFKKWMIPVSTAMSDPKWYHNFKQNHNIFIDKRGVINGIRFDKFSPANLDEKYLICSKDCNNTPDSCIFLSKYLEYLFTLDINNIILGFQEICDTSQNDFNLFDGNEPIIVFIVYEEPSNKCSERIAIHKYFRYYNIEIKELDYPII